jgi:hypothetical protein
VVGARLYLIVQMWRDWHWHDQSRGDLRSHDQSLAAEFGEHSIFQRVEQACGQLDLLVFWVGVYWAYAPMAQSHTNVTPALILIALSFFYRAILLLAVQKNGARVISRDLGVDACQ